MGAEELIVDVGFGITSRIDDALPWFFIDSARKECKMGYSSCLLESNILIFFFSSHISILFVGEWNSGGTHWCLLKWLVY